MARPRLGRPNVHLLVAVAIAGTVSALVPSSATAAPAANTAKPLLPATGSYLGFHGQDMTTIEARMGRRFDVVSHYTRMNGRLANAAKADVAAGRIPLVLFGNGANTAAVARGAYDGYLNSLADSIKALGRPVYVSYAHEMDASANRSWVGSPQAFIQAWRHIHDLFARRGAGNAAWVYTLTGPAFQGNYGSTPANQYYPGDAYVDWIGTDAYNWGGCRGANEWRSFADTFKYFYAWGSRQSKPLMIPETGSVEGAPGAKGQWYVDAAKALRNMPRIKAVTFYSSVDNNGRKRCDWRPTTSSSSLAGFVSMARSFP